MPHVRRYSFQDGLYAFKTDPLVVPFSLGKKESHTEQDKMNRENIPVRRCSSLLDAQNVVKQMHRPGEAATICPVTNIVSSRALSEAYTAESLCRQSDWSSGPMTRIRCWRCSSHRKTGSTWLCLDFFGLGDIGDFHWLLWNLNSRSNVKIYISLPVMTQPSKCDSVWRRSKVYQYTRKRCFSRSSFSSLGTLFMHFTFGQMPLGKV